MYIQVIKRFQKRSNKLLQDKQYYKSSKFSILAINKTNKNLYLLKKLDSLLPNTSVIRTSLPKKIAFN
jgi:hypothetical protein